MDMKSEIRDRVLKYKKMKKEGTLSGNTQNYVYSFGDNLSTAITIPEELCQILEACNELSTNKEKVFPSFIEDDDITGVGTLIGEDSEYYVKPDDSRVIIANIEQHDYETPNEYIGMMLFSEKSLSQLGNWKVGVGYYSTEYSLDVAENTNLPVLEIVEQSGDEKSRYTCTKFRYLDDKPFTIGPEKTFDEKVENFLDELNLSENIEKPVDDMPDGGTTLEEVKRSADNFLNKFRRSR